MPFLNESKNDKVFVVVNLSSEEFNNTLEVDAYAGSYSELFAGEHTNFSGAAELRMNPWEYKVYVKEKSVGLK